MRDDGGGASSRLRQPLPHFLFPKCGRRLRAARMRTNAGRRADDGLDRAGSARFIRVRSRTNQFPRRYERARQRVHKDGAPRVPVQGPPFGPVKPTLHWQSVALVEPAGACELAGQSVHDVLPLVAEYVFAGHSVRGATQPCEQRQRGQQNRPLCGQCGAAGRPAPYECTTTRPAARTSRTGTLCHVHASKMGERKRSVGQKRANGGASMCVRRGRAYGCTARPARGQRSRRCRRTRSHPPRTSHSRGTGGTSCCLHSPCTCWPGRLRGARPNGARAADARVSPAATAAGRRPRLAGHRTSAGAAVRARVARRALARRLGRGPAAGRHAVGRARRAAARAGAAVRVGRAAWDAHKPGGGGQWRQRLSIGRLRNRCTCTCRRPYFGRRWRRRC